MNNPFSQPKVTHKIRFIINYGSIELFENFFPEEILGISINEVKSSTIDSQADDLWSFEVYLEKKPKLNIFTKELLEYADQNNLKHPSEITIEQIEDKDWVAEYQKQQKPLTIGSFFITSTSQKADCPLDQNPIFIEASRAFGTGDHATTSLCIEALESLNNYDFTNIYDIGTGSGILSFAAEKLWPKANILACDIEEISIKLAKDNQNFNNSNIYFYQNSETSLEIPRTWNPKFDLIISNILASPLISLAPSLQSISSSRTKLILSGFLDYQTTELIDTYKKAGFAVEHILQKNKWITLILKVNIN